MKVKLINVKNDDSFGIPTKFVNIQDDEILNFKYSEKKAQEIFENMLIKIPHKIFKILLIKLLKHGQLVYKNLEIKFNNAEVREWKQ